MMCAGSGRPKQAVAISVAVALAALFAACGGTGGNDDSGAKKKITIGLITKEDSNPFFVKMKEGAEQSADKHRVKLLTAAGKFDTDNASQVAALARRLARGRPARSRALRARSSSETSTGLLTPLHRVQDKLAASADDGR